MVRYSGMKAATVMMPIDMINVDQRIYPRISRLDEVTSRYASAMRKGDQFPPIVVSNVKGVWYLVDGYHRLNAALKVGVKELECQVIKCRSLGDAYVEGVKRNAIHGAPFHPAERVIIATNLKEMGYTRGEISDILRMDTVDVERNIIKTMERTSVFTIKRRIGEIETVPAETTGTEIQPSRREWQAPGGFESYAPSPVNGNHNGNHHDPMPVVDFNKAMVTQLAKQAHELWVTWSVNTAKYSRVSERRLANWKRDWVPFEDSSSPHQAFCKDWAKKTLAMLYTVEDK